MLIAMDEAAAEKWQHEGTSLPNVKYNDPVAYAKNSEISTTKSR